MTGSYWDGGAGTASSVSIKTSVFERVSEGIHLLDPEIEQEGDAYVLGERSNNCALGVGRTGPRLGRLQRELIP